MNGNHNYAIVAIVVLCTFTVVLGYLAWGTVSFSCIAILFITFWASVIILYP